MNPEPQSVFQFLLWFLEAKPRLPDRSWNPWVQNFSMGGKKLFEFKNPEERFLAEQKKLSKFFNVLLMQGKRLRPGLRNYFERYIRDLERQPDNDFVEKETQEGGVYFKRAYEGQELEFRLFRDDALGFLYYILVRECKAGTRYRKCGRCLKLFRVHPQTGARSKFCSRRCKNAAVTKAYRHKHRKEFNLKEKIRKRRARSCA